MTHAKIESDTDRSLVEPVSMKSRGSKRTVQREHYLGLDSADENTDGSVSDEIDFRDLKFIGSDFSYHDFRHSNLSNLDLSGCRLVGANLSGCNLSESVLTGCDCTGAILRHTNLSNSNLSGTNFREADLREADLRESSGLLSNRLSGSNLAAARLPDLLGDFDALQIVEEASRNSRTLFLSMLLSCVYCWLTITTTTDPLLMTNSVSSPLPLIDTEIPIAGFFWAAPTILLCVYIYFQVSLQRLWDVLADLPAVFPDGSRLDRRIYPWLLSGLVTVQLKNLRNNRPDFSRLQSCLSIGLAWCLVPATMLIFWARYLTRHEWLGTAYLIVLTILAVSFGMAFYANAVATLRSNEKHSRPDWKLILVPQSRTRVLLISLTSIALISLSFGTIHGVSADGQRESNLSVVDLRVWTPRLMLVLGFRPFVDFIEQDISEKHSGWSNNEESNELGRVKGARLKGANLTYAEAQGSFMVNADLRVAKLDGANFSGVDMRYADLRYASLVGTVLDNAKLDQARMKGANFTRASLNLSDQVTRWLFRNKDLSETRFRGVDLQNMEFWSANLENASFNSAKLNNASFYQANVLNTDFRGAMGLTLEQFRSSKNLMFSQLDKTTLAMMQLPSNLEEKIDVRDFSELNISGHSFSKIDLSGYSFRGTKISDVKFENVNLQNTNFDGATLIRVEIRNSDLRESNMNNMTVEESEIWKSDLSNASLRNSRFLGVSLVEVPLVGSDMRDLQIMDGSFVNWVDFENAEIGGSLFNVKHLEIARNLTCEQFFTSKNKTDTWAEDLLPDSLRGCGAAVQIEKEETE